MATVYISEKYADVVERMVQSQIKSTGTAIFKTQMNLMVFAALIGFDAQERSDSPGRRKGSEIYDNIFERHGTDGIAFLMALQETRDGEILRDKNEAECWKVLEDYADTGFNIIQAWLLDNPVDTDGVTTILNQMKIKAAGVCSDDDESDGELDVKF